jgi:hypothetical protein
MTGLPLPGHTRDDLAGVLATAKPGNTAPRAWAGARRTASRFLADPYQALTIERAERLLFLLSSARRSIAATMPHGLWEAERLRLIADLELAAEDLDASRRVAA